MTTQVEARPVETPQARVEVGNGRLSHAVKAEWIKLWSVRSTTWHGGSTATPTSRSNLLNGSCRQPYSIRTRRLSGQPMPWRGGTIPVVGRQATDGDVGTLQGLDIVL